MPKPRYEGRPLDLAAMERRSGETAIYNPWRGRWIYAYRNHGWWVTDGTVAVPAWSAEDAQVVAEIWSKSKRAPRRYKRTAISA